MRARLPGDASEPRTEAIHIRVTKTARAKLAAAAEADKRSLSDYTALLIDRALKHI